MGLYFFWKLVARYQLLVNFIRGFIKEIGEGVRTNLKIDFCTSQLGHPKKGLKKTNTNWFRN